MTEAIKAFILKLIASMTSKLGGVAGVVVRYVLNYGGQVILDALADWQRKAQRDAAQKKAAEEYKKIEAKPDSTVEERAKAYEDYMNAGR